MKWPRKVGLKVSERVKEGVAFCMLYFVHLRIRQNVKTPSLQEATAMLHPENDTHLPMAASKISSAIFSLCDHLLTVEG